LTGDCKWPTIPPLAVCGECQEVTSQLNYTAGKSLDTWILPNEQEYINSSDIVITPTWYGSTSFYQNPISPYLSIFDKISINTTHSTDGNATAVECAM
jgi:hypothetical protein